MSSPINMNSSNDYPDQTEQLPADLNDPEYVQQLQDTAQQLAMLQAEEYSLGLYVSAVDCTYGNMIIPTLRTSDNPTEASMD